MMKYVRWLMAGMLAGLLLLTAAGCVDGFGEDDSVSPSQIVSSTDMLNALLHDISDFDAEAEQTTPALVRLELSLLDWVKLQPDPGASLDTLNTYWTSLDETQQQRFAGNYLIVRHFNAHWNEALFEDRMAESAAVSDSDGWQGNAFYRENWGVEPGQYHWEDFERCSDWLLLADEAILGKQFNEYAEDAEVYDNLHGYDDGLSEESGDTPFDRELFADAFYRVAYYDSLSMASYYRSLNRCAYWMQVAANSADCTEAELHEGLDRGYHSYTVVDRAMFDVNLNTVMQGARRMAEDRKWFDELEEDAQVDFNKYSDEQLTTLAEELSRISGVTH